MLDTFPLAQRTSFFQETARMIIFAQIAKERALSSKDVDAINIDSGNRALKIWTVNSSNSSLRNLSAEEEMTKSIVLQCAPRNEQTSALRKRVFPFLNKKD